MVEKRVLESNSICGLLRTDTGACVMGFDIRAYLGSVDRFSTYAATIWNSVAFTIGRTTFFSRRISTIP
jgi:hypothetical protein